jgi:hypothetical protein
MTFSSYNYIILYYIILYYIILYYIILHYIILYYIILPHLTDLIGIKVVEEIISLHLETP